MSGEDEYERRYMGDGGIVYQCKTKAPAAFHWLVLLPPLFASLVLGITALATAAPAALMLAALPTFLITIPIWLLFSVLRATVTATHLHIQYGLFGPKIPLSSISKIEAVRYDWKQYGGFGIRRGRDGSWAYNMMGDQGRAVRIGWRDEKGRETVTLLSTTDPDALVAAVEKARAGSTSPARARIGAADAPKSAATDADVAEAERELESELEAEAARRKDRS